MKLNEWIKDLLSRGKYSFAINDVKSSFPHKSDKATEMSLYRAMSHGEIQSAFNGFYTIVPVQYRNLGGLPPSMYIDDLMSYLDRDYYIAHLSAATLHGSSHQQPQEYYVVHNKQSLRKVNKGIMPINFCKKQSWINKAVDQKKSEAGYINVSNPLQTSFDLISDQNISGGINRAATIINELVDLINLDTDIISGQHQVTIQRFGFILDALGWQMQADQLYELVYKNQKPKNRYPLKSGKPQKGYSSKNRWNIIENTSIEIDE